MYAGTAALTRDETLLFAFDGRAQSDKIGNLPGNSLNQCDVVSLRSRFGARYRVAFSRIEGGAP